MRPIAVCSAALLVVAACASRTPSPTPTPRAIAYATSVPTATPVPPDDVYGHIHAGDLAPQVQGVKSLVYVPNSESNTVDVIDPAQMKIVDHFAVGRLPQHVTPSWDMRTLYVDNDKANTLTKIDPTTGHEGTSFPVDDPYNLYFTPDGSHAIVVAERLERLDIRDPRTWELQTSIPIDHLGPNHLDFSADGRFLIVSCEFSGWIVKVDLVRRQVVDGLHIGGKPVDVRLGPDGKQFFVANEWRNGVSVVDPVAMRELKFIRTGAGTHGFVVSRDGRSLYVTNRGAGTVSVLDFATASIVRTWYPGGSPDMGGVSADGKVLWISGRYSAAVYAIDTETGKLIATIPVGFGPHGVCVFPQPGRYSLGHTGNYR